MPNLKYKIIISGIAVIIAIVIWGVFNGQKNSYIKQIAQAKLEASEIGYQAGVAEVNNTIGQIIFQYHALPLTMPINEKGEFDQNGKATQTVIFIPYQNSTTTK